VTAAPTYDDILAARERIAGEAVRTPLLHSPFLSERLGARVFLKPECLQRTGSFKFRGAWSAVQALGAVALERGVAAESSGNHAQGVAEAARLVGARATIVMPTDAPEPKRRRTERSGGRIVSFDRATEDRDAVFARTVEKLGAATVHPFNDPFVIAGQGTVGLEIADDCTAFDIEPDIVALPCSGGGLTAGVTLAVKERFPAAKVYTAEPEGFDDYARSLAAGERVRNERRSGSICDALLVPEPGAIGWEINRLRVAGGLVASDREALIAVGLCFDELRLVVEPGGAVALAAILSGRLEVRGKTVVLVLSGGNIGDEMLAEGLNAYRSTAESRSL
jgi:threonine dehydratase